MKDKRAKPRWLQHLIAILGGYFWLPCPGCGEKFGGHEEHGYLAENLGGGQMVCLNCADWAKKETEKIYKISKMI